MYQLEEVRRVETMFGLKEGLSKQVASPIFQLNASSWKIGPAGDLTQESTADKEKVFW